MGKILSVIGIILVMIGTIASLWSVITTNSNIVGTVGYSFDGELIQKNFKKQKKQVILGSIIIIIGSILQCAALFL